MRNLLAMAAVSVLFSVPAAAQSGDEPVYQSGNGVTSPVLIKEVKPNYSGDAMRRKVQGAVELSAVVRADGSVGDTRVTKSLDPDLDNEAIKAAKQWRFKPGTKDGKPVNVHVMLELSFTLRDRPPAYRPGNGVTMPVAIKTVNPQYEDSARRDGVQGLVALTGVVEPDGTITEIGVTKSLDERLDREAIKALAQWRFTPGEKNGAVVRVLVQIEMTFNLK